MSFFAYWVNNLDPFLIRFSGDFGIRYYGLAYLCGFAAGAWLLFAYAKSDRSRLPAALVLDFMTALVIGVLVGGRLGYFLLYQFHALITEPWVIFRVWDGGMASHGGFAGVALAVAWFARKRRIPFLHLGDLIASVTPVGLFFGRIANFINGELWGKPSTVPWAVIYPRSPAPLVPRHPSELYEAALEGLLLFIFVQWRFWRSHIVLRRPGRLAGEFLIAYAIARAIGEIFREPDASLILGLSRGTFYSIFLVIAGVWLITRQSRPLDPPAGVK